MKIAVLYKYMSLKLLHVTGNGHGGDREVTLSVKRGVEAKNYEAVRFFII